MSASFLDSRPLKGLKVGLISETINDGVDAEVVSSVQDAASHLEALGCTVTEVFPDFIVFSFARFICSSLTFP